MDLLAETSFGSCQVLKLFVYTRHRALGLAFGVYEQFEKQSYTKPRQRQIAQIDAQPCFLSGGVHCGSSYRLMGCTGSGLKLEEDCAIKALLPDMVAEPGSNS